MLHFASQTEDRDSIPYGHSGIVRIDALAGTPEREGGQVGDANRGKPRTVNNISVAALIAAYATGKKIVDQTAARAAVSEVTTSE